MVERRQVLAGGLMAGLVGTMLPSESATAATGGGAAAAAGAAGGASGAAAADENTPILQRILEELQYQRASCGTGTCPGIESIRRQQRTYLKSSGRYPEFIDVGLDAWEQVYEWHVKYHIPIKIDRLADGFYGMPFYLTTLVLKPNMNEQYVGPAYDAR